jgi:hypothetical protein
MGDSIAKIVMGVLVVIFAYNMLTHESASQGIIGSSASGSAKVISSLQGR